MPVEFACSSCHLKYSVKDELAGRTAKCGKCGHRMRIPQLTAAKPVASVSAREKAVGARGASRREAGVGETGFSKSRRRCCLVA